jgi:hypothetical protein
VDGFGGFTEPFEFTSESFAEIDSRNSILVKFGSHIREWKNGFRERGKKG